MIAFQGLFDMVSEYKYHGYWYFSKEVERREGFTYMILIPVNMFFRGF